MRLLDTMLIPAVAARWNFMDFQSPKFSAIMMEFTTPESYGTTVVNVGGIVRDGEIICAGANTSCTHTEVQSDEENEWPAPKAATYKWAGKTADGKDVEAELSGELGERLDRIDVMAEVPGFVKQLVAGVAGTKPYIYQVGGWLRRSRATCLVSRILTERDVLSIRPT
jgi:hypothetical protein